MANSTLVQALGSDYRWQRQLENWKDTCWKNCPTKNDRVPIMDVLRHSGEVKVIAPKPLLDEIATKTLGGTGSLLNHKNNFTFSIQAHAMSLLFCILATLIKQTTAKNDEPYTAKSSELYDPEFLVFFPFLIASMVILKIAELED